MCSTCTSSARLARPPTTPHSPTGNTQPAADLHAANDPNPTTSAPPSARHYNTCQPPLHLTTTHRARYYRVTGEELDMSIDPKVPEPGDY